MAVGNSYTTAGVGGAGKGTTNGAMGGAATSSANVTGTNNVTANVRAQGGNGGSALGSSGIGGIGGSATANASATDTSSTAALAYGKAYARAGTSSGISPASGTVGGTATGVTATATGVSVKARAGQTGGVGSATGKITGAYATTVRTVTYGGIGAAPTNSTAGSYTTSLSATQNSTATATANAYSTSAAMLCTANATANARTANGQVATATTNVKGAATNAVILGYAAQGAAAIAASSGTQTPSSTDTFTLNAVNLTGHLILGLVTPEFAGTPFTSLTLTTTAGGVTIAGASGTFTTRAAAQNFFANDAIDLGVVSAVNSLTVQISETMVTSTVNDAFGNELVLGATGGYGPPVFAGPAAIPIATAAPETVTGLTLSEVGHQSGESYAINVADTFGTLALTQSGTDIVTGSGSASVTITGDLADVNATLTETDSSSRYDTIAASGASANGGTATTFDIGVCFLAGTNILTDHGEKRVEHLAVGDLVKTASDEIRPIAWIGKGSVVTTRGRRTAATPVIVRKGALADNVPAADLHIAKAHSLFIDGVLIPVELLINHRSILWDYHARKVTIYHIE